MKRDKMIEWMIQITLFAFTVGGAYFMLKDHEKRISNIETERKEEYKERLRRAWERNPQPQPERVGR